jgi:hypothetical protein
VKYEREVSSICNRLNELSRAYNKHLRENNAKQSY